MDNGNNDNDDDDQLRYLQDALHKLAVKNSGPFKTFYRGHNMGKKNTKSADGWVINHQWLKNEVKD